MLFNNNLMEQQGIGQFLQIDETVDMFLCIINIHRTVFNMDCVVLMSVAKE